MGIKDRVSLRAKAALEGIKKKILTPEVYEMVGITLMITVAVIGVYLFISSTSGRSFDSLDSVALFTAIVLGVSAIANVASSMAITRSSERDAHLFNLKLELEKPNLILGPDTFVTVDSDSRGATNLKLVLKNKGRRSAKSVAIKYAAKNNYRGIGVSGEIRLSGDYLLYPNDEALFAPIVMTTSYEGDNKAEDKLVFDVRVYYQDSDGTEYKSEKMELQFTDMTSTNRSLALKTAQTPYYIQVNMNPDEKPEI